MSGRADSVDYLLRYLDRKPQKKMENYHVPVLLNESVDLMEVSATGVYLDLTFGGGGHSREILRRMGKRALLLGFDQDLDAMDNIPNDSRFLFVRGNFKFLRGFVRAHGVGDADAILGDLGVSSHHFDCSERGFSYRFDAPLDMRMNREGGFSAKELLETYTVAELRRVFKDYGELNNAHKLAMVIDNYRKMKPLVSINDLIAAIAPCTPRGEENKYYAKVFQALRIEVNGEMEALKMALEQSLKVLKKGGRLVIITYHSLEDRLVKNFMKCGNFEGQPIKDFYGNVESPFTVVTGKPIVPSDEELERNPRSRSAKLRCAIKK